MKVIKAKPEHVHTWVDMAEKFNEEALLSQGEDWGFNRDDCESTYFAFMQGNIGYFLEHEGKLVGVLALVVARHLMNYQFNYCLEAMFYVEPKHRGYSRLLIKAVEKEAQERGLNRIVMAHTLNEEEKISRFYEACGYRRFETQYVKDFK